MHGITQQGDIEVTADRITFNNNIRLTFGRQELEGMCPNCSKVVYLDSIKTKRVTRIICPHCMESYPVKLI